ncbi:hypothetical protein ACFY00_38025 [Kitasatospora sp. NPDC001540]|uniref:hypothetical protein n=1 Tax=Kitasatospora sp. NPDC001540 TaxID=3364014 RepID=UPI00367C4F42
MRVTDKKLDAVCYVDDRAVACTGNWTEASATARHHLTLTTDPAAPGSAPVTTDTPAVTDERLDRNLVEALTRTTDDVSRTDQKAAAEHNAMVSALDDGSPLERSMGLARHDAGPAPCWVSGSRGVVERARSRKPGLHRGGEGQVRVGVSSDVNRVYTVSPQAGSSESSTLCSAFSRSIRARATAAA